MQVKFALDLGRSSISVGPFTYLKFHYWDIPREVWDEQALGAEP